MRKITISKKNIHLFERAKRFVLPGSKKTEDADFIKSFINRKQKKEITDRFADKVHIFDFFAVRGTDFDEFDNRRRF